MSNCRSHNTSPHTNQDTFLTFLEPSPRHMPPTLSNTTARAPSPRLITKVSPSSKSPIPTCHKTTSNQALTLKHSQMLQERNKVLLKEKQRLQRKLTKEIENPKNVFKNQALSYAKESYLKRVETKTNGRRVSDFEEKLPAVRKILNWMNEQTDDTELKYVKAGILEAIEKLRGFEIEMEASNAYVQRQHEKKVKLLEDKIECLNKQISNIGDDAISALVKKNGQLSTVIRELERKNEELSALNLGLSKENESLKKPEVSEMAMIEFEAQVKRRVEEELLQNMIAVETEYLEMKESLIKANGKNEKKEKEICELNQEILGLRQKTAKVKEKYGRVLLDYRIVKKKYEDKLRFEMVDKDVKQKVLNSAVNNKENTYDNVLSCAICLAAALEDFLQ